MVRTTEDKAAPAPVLPPESLLPEVYGTLRSLAGRYLRHERVGHTLQPTALVHEACIRLLRGGVPTLDGSGHLIGLAARSMRQVLVNYAEHHRAARRGGDRHRVGLEPALEIYEERCVDLVALDDALDRLATLDARQAHVVELRFFGGLTVPEVARLLDTSPRTVEREWTMARAAASGARAMSTFECTERWHRVKQLFHELRDLDPSRRTAFLDATCGDDGSIRLEIETLLDADAPDEFLVPPDDPSVAALLADDADSPVPPDRLGPWAVLEPIARGGMGAVYRGRRDDDAYDQDVAIKILDRRLSTPRARRRFARERQALARLGHPNITRLLDGGTTPDGLPYLVMELVDGQPIDAHCNTREYTPTERVRLFHDVCSAVSAAHAQLIVHRDLKPANILVTADGTVKLLDFGIAHVVDDEIPGRTRTVDRAMTPEYGSPEQLRGESTTTATDVYSLGAILYELLTGRRPHHVDELTPYEAARRVCEVDPPAPSTAIGRSDATPVLARSESRDRRRALTGDLDTIVLTALQRDPTLRYGSVEQLDEDLRRHLASLPILARSEPLSTRTRKFARRHRSHLLATSIAVIALLVALASTSFGLVQARHERRDAIEARNETQRVLAFYENMLASANAFRNGRNVTLLELLSEAESRLSMDPEEHAPATRAGIHLAIARSYVSLMRWRRAAPHLRAALAHYRESDSDASQLVQTECMVLLGRAQTHLKHPDAVATQRESLAMRIEQLGPEHPLVAEATGCLGFALWASGAPPQYDEAERHYLRAIEQYDRLGLHDTRDAARMNMSLGYMYEHLERYDEAETQYRSALASYAHCPVTTDLYEFASRNCLAGLLERTGRLDEAADILEDYRAALPRDFDHWRHRQSTWQIAELRDRAGHLERAAEQYREALALELDEVARSDRTARDEAVELARDLRTPCPLDASAHRIQHALDVLVARPLAPDATYASRIGAALDHARRSGHLDVAVD